MTNIGVISLDPSSTEKSCNGNQLCFLSIKQIGSVGDIFSLNFNGDLHYFKIIDIWNTPKDFARDFLWRLCGQESKDDLNIILDKLDYNMIFAHIYIQVSWTDIRRLVNYD